MIQLTNIFEMGWKHQPENKYEFEGKIGAKLVKWRGSFCFCECVWICWKAPSGTTEKHQFLLRKALESNDLGTSIRASLLNYCNSRWWFWIFVIFTPILGEMINVASYLSNGLKPPASIELLLFTLLWTADLYKTHPKIAAKHSSKFQLLEPSK